MTHTLVNYADVEAVGDGMHFMRDELDCERLGFTVVDVDGGWTGKRHDHADSAHEEVYYLAAGAANVEVDGEPVDLAPGDALRVSPPATRQVQAGDEGATLLIVGAP